MALPVSYVDLVLGTSIEIPHIDGSTLKIIVNAGSKPGETVTIPNRGLPYPRGGRGRGAVMVLLKLAMPNKLSHSTKKQLKELKENLGSGVPVTDDIISEARDRRRS